MTHELDAERQSIANVVARLVSCHPGITMADMDCLVQSIYERFVDARVRDFIPLLVERRAREELTRGNSSPDPTRAVELFRRVDLPMVERLNPSGVDSAAYRTA